MLGSYWRVIFAIVGLGLSPSPQAQAQGEQASTTQQSQPNADATSSANSATQRRIQKRPCAEGHYASSDDLCAQWKAADSARNAADWAWWQLWLSFIGVVGLGLTLWFNFRALRISEDSAKETRDALQIARDNAKVAADNAKAAFDANEIARRAAKEAKIQSTAQSRHARQSERRHLRAYIGANDVTNGGWNDEGFPYFIVSIKNFGQTPAMDVHYAAKAAANEDGVAGELIWDSPSQYLAPTQKWGIPVLIREQFDMKDGAGVIVCEVRYTDVFGAVWALHQRFVRRTNGIWYSDKTGNYEKMHKPGLID